MDLMRILENMRLAMSRAWDRLHPHCPDCGGRLDTYYDPAGDEFIHVCRKCYKEYWRM